MLIYPELDKPAAKTPPTKKHKRKSTLEALFDYPLFKRMMDENRLEMRDFLTVQDQFGNEVQASKHPYHVFFARSDRFIMRGDGQMFCMRDIGEVALDESWWNPEAGRSECLTVNKFLMLSDKGKNVDTTFML